MTAKLILISGYPAAGKSTFSRKMSDKFGIPCFNKDTLKESIANGFGEESQEVRGKGSAATFNVIEHIAECFLKAGGICILESNFRIDEGERLKALAEKYRAECLTIILTGDLDTLYDRYLNRDDAGERHWVHHGAGDRNSFKDILTKWKIGQIEVGEVIRVDTTDFGAVDFGKLFDEVKSFMNG